MSITAIFRSEQGTAHRSVVLTFLLTVIAGLFTAVPALAHSEDMTQGEFAVSVSTTPSCSPDGFSYEIHLHNPPSNAHWNNVAQWREQGSDQHQTVYGDSGFIASGAGDFEIRVFAIQNANGHFIEHGQTDWQPVNVFCPGIKPTETDPVLVLDVEVTCETEPGVNYELALHNGPATNHLYSVDWQELPAGTSGSESGKSGFIATGEGEFELVGQAKGIALGAESFTSDAHVVTVDCPDDEDEDKPKIGNPTYTG